MWLWIALFTLPFMYRACRHALDALVEETLLFVAEVVRGGETTALPSAKSISDDRDAVKLCKPDLLCLHTAMKAWMSAFPAQTSASCPQTWR